MQIHTRDAFVTTVHLPIVLHARCIVSRHIFSLSGSLRLLQLTLIYQFVVITRIFRLDFITVGEDDIIYAKSNLMIMILKRKFEILQELQQYVIDDVLYLSNFCCRHVNTNHQLSLTLWMSDDTESQKSVFKNFNNLLTEKNSMHCEIKP